MAQPLHPPDLIFLCRHSLDVRTPGAETSIQVVSLFIRSEHRQCREALVGHTHDLILASPGHPEKHVHINARFVFFFPSSAA